MLSNMVTRKVTDSKPRKRLLTTPNVIRLIIIWSTISSLFLVFNSDVWQQQWYDQQEMELDYGAPPPKISTKAFDILNVQTKVSVPGPSKPAAHEILITTTNSTSARNKTHSLLHKNKGCLSRLNSQSWLDGTRFGNQNRTDSRGIDDDYVVSSILNTASLFSDFETNSQTLLKQTLCAETSRFRNLKFTYNAVAKKSNGSYHDQIFFDTTGMTKNQTIHHLSLRLLYLSVHVHQHRHATKEAEHRFANPEQCENDMIAKGIGKFDFECPDAKFLVVPMKISGLGSQMRLIVAPSLMAGIATDRVVIFVNNSPVGPRFIQERWKLSSCSRFDKQCFFLPDTPCVLTHDEVQNATVLTKGEIRALFKRGEMPQHLENERVILMDGKSQPRRMPPTFKSNLADIARKFLIHPLETENPSDPILPLLHAAADHILEEDEDVGDSFYYYSRTIQAHHAMIFYAMRPKVEYAKRIDAIVASTLGDNHRTNLSLGLPIRASDKCHIESECPSFDTYMSLMQNVWETNEKQLLDARKKEIANSKTLANSSQFTKIILTSESPDVFEAQRLFQSQNSTYPTNITFPFKFVTNSFDVLQNTGEPKRMPNSEGSKEEILVSSLSSLKLQFYAKYNVGNCCSNYHLLLFDFLYDGCGASESGHVANCMQDHEDERYRICCSWTKTDECKAKRERRENETATM